MESYRHLILKSKNKAFPFVKIEQDCSLGEILFFKENLSLENIFADFFFEFWSPEWNFSDEKSDQVSESLSPQ